MEVTAASNSKRRSRGVSPLRIRRLLDAAQVRASSDRDGAALKEIASRYDVKALRLDEVDSLCQELYCGGWIGYQDQALLALPGRDLPRSSQTCDYLSTWEQLIDAHEHSGRQEPLRHAKRILTILSSLAALRST